MYDFILVYSVPCKNQGQVLRLSLVLISVVIFASTGLDRLRYSNNISSQALHHKILLSLTHGLEGCDCDLQHGRVGFARCQGLQGKVRLDHEAHDG
jgi:hypothetical protein